MSSPGSSSFWVWEVCVIRLPNWQRPIDIHLCGKVLDLVMDDVRILDSEIAIEKPGAIPEADGVVVTMRAKR